VLRNCGKRITATFKQVRELDLAYQEGFLTPKTLANTLRLMRLELSSEVEDTFIDRLRRNVQIGCIKRGIRLATVGRYCERVMTKTHNMHPTSVKTKGQSTVDAYAYFDTQAQKKITAGFIVTDTVDNLKTVIVSKLSSEEVDMITPKLLNERSTKRCIRLNKSHINQHAEP